MIKRASALNCTIRFFAGFLAIVVVAAAIWPHLPKRYEAYASVVLLVATRDDDPGATVKQMRQMPDELETQSDIDLISSPALAEKLVDQHDLMSDSEFNGSGDLVHWIARLPLFHDFVPPPQPLSRLAVRDRLLKHLVVSRDRRSYTVTFGFWSRDPEKAAQLTQSLLAGYIDLQQQQKKKAISRVSAWLEDRVTRMRAQTAAADKAFEGFMQSNGLMDEGADITLRNELNALSTDYSTTKARMISDSIRLDALKAMQAKGSLEDSPEALASQTVQKLKESRSASLVRPGALLAERQAANSEIVLELDHIVASVATQVLVDRERLQRLDTEIANLRGSIERRGKAKLHVRALERDAKTSSAALEDSLGRLNGQTSLALSVAPDVEVIGKPETPGEPKFPNPLLAALGTLLMGTLCGAALAFRFRFAGEPAEAYSGVRGLLGLRLTKAATNDLL